MTWRDGCRDVSLNASRHIWLGFRPQLYATYYSITKCLNYQETKRWLWLFSVCHFVVVIHPSQSFEVEYIRLFRATHLLLQNFVPKIKDSEELTTCRLLTSGRICLPRLLFVFQSNTASMHLPPKKGGHSYFTTWNFGEKMLSLVSDLTKVHEKCFMHLIT